MRWAPGAPGLRLLISLVLMRTLDAEGFSTELGAHLGRRSALEPVLWPIGYFRTAHNHDDGVIEPISSAPAHPGAGIPNVVGSAKTTGKLMLDDPARQKVAA
jgi:phytoene desaturase